MTILKEVFYTLKPVKSYLVKKNIENLVDNYLTKISSTTNKFRSNFFSQVFNCASADILEFYIESTSNIRYLNEANNTFDYETTEQLLKWFSLYNTLRFRSESLEQNEVDSLDYTDLLYIFQFSNYEKQFIIKIVDIINFSETEFQIMFANYIIENVFDYKNNTILLAFVVNFLYNSYDSFIKSFNAYVEFRAYL